MSMYLMLRHATHYLKPWEQKHIIRILFMVPIYSIVSFLSYVFYIHSVYFDVLRDCYEAFAIASFFALVCHYVAPDLHNQKDYFRGLKPKPWVLPLSWFRRCCGGERGCVRTPRSGLTWFNIIWLGVFQYCFIRVFCTFIAVVTQAAGRYCLTSDSPLFAHIWVTVFEGIGVTVAMYCLIQFYVQLRYDLAEHKPGIKVVSIKLVIFLSFWQTMILGFLTSQNVIKESPTISSQDINIGIPAMLLCIEMAIFSILHQWAYPWKVYDIHRSQIVAAEGGSGLHFEGQAAYRGGPLGLYAFMDAFNPWDILKAVARGFRWMFVGRKSRETDISYKPHLKNPSTDTPSSGASKPSGKYRPLHGNDSDSYVPSYPQQPRAPADPRSFSKPFAAPQPETDLGAVGALDRSQEGWDGARPVYVPPLEDTGYHGAQGTSYARPQNAGFPSQNAGYPPQDVGYQAPHGGDPRREEWADPRDHGGRYGGGSGNMI
ncbi:hypothetical protein MMC13_002653 [Lambiella insularis]|nr:hypothetical protein [Lambiella insularis]